MWGKLRWVAIRTALVRRVRLSSGLVRQLWRGEFWHVPLCSVTLSKVRQGELLSRR